MDVVFDCISNICLSIGKWSTTFTFKWFSLVPLQFQYFKFGFIWQHQNRNARVNMNRHIWPNSHQMKIYETHCHFDKWHYFLSPSKSAFYHIDVIENQPTPINLVIFFCSFVVVEKNRNEYKWCIFSMSIHITVYWISSLFPDAKNSSGLFDFLKNWHKWNLLRYKLC